MWIDIHAHLYDKSDLELTQCLENANSRGVDSIVNSSVSIESAEKVLLQCQRDGVSLYGTAGISPFDCESVGEDWDKKLESILDNDLIIGIGEIGLDKTNSRYPSFRKQISLFEKQLEISINYGMPVIVHSRGAEREVLGICKNHNVLKVIFHCFTGNKDTLRKLLDAGYHVSYSGIITFKNNSLEDCVHFTPIDRLFIETDSPYLSPHPYRGKPNEPAHVVFIGEKIALLKKQDTREVAENIRQNFSRLFNISASAF